MLTVLDVFKPDENFMEHEEKYKQLKKGTFMKLCHVVILHFIIANKLKLQTKQRIINYLCGI